MNKQKNKIEKYFEKKWVEDGFTFTMKKQYLSKTIYEVSRDGISYMYDLPCVVEDVKRYYEAFFKAHNMQVELNGLREQVKKQ